jgi:hypothetical protein
MEKKVSFEYDAERNILFTDDSWDVKTREDVDAFFAEYLEFFEKLGKKVYIVANINNLVVRAAIADYYGETSLKTVEKYVLGLARWGSNDWARMTVRTTSLKAKMTPNIHATREEAIQAILEMQQGGEEPGSFEKTPGSIESERVDESNVSGAGESDDD